MVCIVMIQSTYIFFYIIYVGICYVSRYNLSLVCLRCSYSFHGLLYILCNVWCCTRTTDPFMIGDRGDVFAVENINLSNYSHICSRLCVSGICTIIFYQLRHADRRKAGCFSILIMQSIMCANIWVLYGINVFVCYKWGFRSMKVVFVCA